MNSFSLTNWMKDESGAVTVDWTVLAAAVVGLGIASVAAVRSGAGDLATDIGNALSSASVATLGALGAGTTEDGGDYVHALLVASEDMYASWMSELESYSDEDVAAIYASYAADAASFIESGDMNSAAIYLDVLAAVNETLADRGLDIPDGSATVQDLDDAYQEAA